MAEALTLNDFVNPGVIEAAGDLARSFREGQPFRHVVIDDFLAAGFCARICEEFPKFREQDAINENEEIGGKATRELVRSLGPAFEAADDLVRHTDFLSLIERITGVEDLQYDPFYFGGGTHESRQGQDLDPHIDFNYHPVTSQHRRLNLIVYLNEEWDDAWGGSLQLHRDPYREPSEDEILTVTPLRNRCVIFETSEHSWHGFEAIRLPDGCEHLTRKSFAVYYYTDLRPAAEMADPHSTVYVERHLPERFAAGMVLDEADLAEIRGLLKRRDRHLQRIYRDVQEANARFDALGQPGKGGIAPLTLEDVPDDLKSAVRLIRILRQQVSDYEHSTSWRITAPLRGLKRLFTGRS